MKKVWILLAVLALAVVALGSLPNSLPGQMALFVSNPLSLSVVGSDGNPGSVGRVVHKFGYNDTNAASDDVWDCSEAAIGGPATYPFQAAAYTLYASSDAAGDNGLELTVEGIDANWDRQVVETTLDAVDATDFVTVGTASNWLRVYRAYNSSDTAYTGNIYLIDDATDVGGDGIPDNIATLQACIQIGNGQTLMAIYTTADNEWTWFSQYCATALDTTPGVDGYSTVAVMSRLNLPVPQTFRISTLFSLATKGTSDRCEPIYPPLYVGPRTDIKLRTISASSVEEVSGTFNMTVITNSN